jgi:hypothetical protein
MTTKTKGGAQRIDYSEAEQLLRQGVTQEDVARKFGVSQSAISAAIGRGRIKFDTGFTKRLPWRIKKEHHNLAIPRNLRLAMRVQAGDTDMDPRLLASAVGFLHKLEELDAVIHYDPEVEPYFFRVKRRPEIDKGLVREPDA